MDNFCTFQGGEGIVFEELTCVGRERGMKERFLVCELVTIVSSRVLSDASNQVAGQCVLTCTLIASLRPLMKQYL